MALPSGRFFGRVVFQEKKSPSPRGTLLSLGREVINRSARPPLPTTTNITELALVAKQRVHLFLPLYVKTRTTCISPLAAQRCSKKTIPTTTTAGWSLVQYGGVIASLQMEGFVSRRTSMRTEKTFFPLSWRKFKCGGPGGRQFPCLGSTWFDFFPFIYSLLFPFPLPFQSKGLQTDYHPGLPSPVSLGPDSKYVVPWQVETKLEGMLYIYRWPWARNLCITFILVALYSFHMCPFFVHSFLGQHVVKANLTHIITYLSLRALPDFSCKGK